jgi:hypothetical protein
MPEKAFRRPRSQQSSARMPSGRVQNYPRSKTVLAPPTRFKHGPNMVRTWSARLRAGTFWAHSGTLCAFGAKCDCALRGGGCALRALSLAGDRSSRSIVHAACLRLSFRPSFAHPRDPRCRCAATARTSGWPLPNLPPSGGCCKRA